ncbi:hypothetical protein CEXT_495971 [Caerostris extrusa]|uniref:Uncharacterized protein n=1 Tax=Caerostris extrusa TaxID=172846 RepID=A0AAV4V5P6_CAEEX|nr:hypothetical protein CEXT_495971 [Caerostris extrusa]
MLNCMPTTLEPFLLLNSRGRDLKEERRRQNILVPCCCNTCCSGRKKKKTDLRDRCCFKLCCLCNPSDKIFIQHQSYRNIQVIPVISNVWRPRGNDGLRLK